MIKSISFELDDLDAFVKGPERSQVKFVVDTFETPVCRLAVLADPDGNEVILHKRHAD